MWATNGCSAFMGEFNLAPGPNDNKQRTYRRRRMMSACEQAKISNEGKIRFYPDDEDFKPLKYTVVVTKLHFIIRPRSVGGGVGGRYINYTRII